MIFHHHHLEIEISLWEEEEEGHYHQMGDCNGNHHLGKEDYHHHVYHNQIFNQEVMTCTVLGHTTDQKIDL